MAASSAAGRALRYAGGSARGNLLHQPMRHDRRRPGANRWIGQRLDEPAVDIPSLARSYGCHALPSVEDGAALMAALGDAMDRVSANGEVVVLDVRVHPGYASAMPTDTD